MKVPIDHTSTGDECPEVALFKMLGSIPPHKPARSRIVSVEMFESF